HSEGLRALDCDGQVAPGGLEEVGDPDSRPPAAAPPGAERALYRGSNRGDVVSGFVSIVGAGPGSAELLTLKAVRRLEEADVVLHDALVSSEVLEYAPRARRVYVGKRGHRPS